MFDLSKKTDYGLELMIYLAQVYGQGPLSLRVIAKEKKLPLRFLEQIAGELRQSGLIESKEGKGGGYFLANKPKSISVEQIVQVLEGPFALGACAGCPKAGACGQQDVWQDVGDQVRKTIKKKTLADLIKKKKK